MPDGEPGQKRGRERREKTNNEEIWMITEVSGYGTVAEIGLLREYLLLKS